MSVAFDATAAPAGGGGLGNISWTHAPVGTPRALMVFAGGITGADTVTSVTHNGISLTETADSPVLKSAVEAGEIYGYFKGSSIATGAQTVQVNVTGSSHFGRSYTLTADADTEVVDTATINGDSLVDPSTTLALGGRTCWCAINFLSGQDAVTGITPLAGWTADGEIDGGTMTAGAYRYTTVGTADVAAGWTQAAEDAIALAVAISEVAGVTLVVAEAAHAHAADSPTLVQAYVLAVHDAAHGHAADAPILSQATELAPSDALHAHTAGSPSLVQANLLVVTDASHAHAADAPTLSQAHLLAIAEALHAHSADQVALELAGVLGVHEALHAHAADSPTLIQGHLLAVQEALHQHSAEAPMLSIAFLLSVADALHAHSAEAPTLSSTTLLTVAEALHGHLADGLVLGEAATLAVADALHAHSADHIVWAYILAIYAELLVYPALAADLRLTPAVGAALRVEPFEV